MSDADPSIWVSAEPDPADGRSLADEPFTLKAERLLRNLRGFANSSMSVGAIEVDGCKIMLVKYLPDRHLFIEPEPGVSA